MSTTHFTPTLLIASLALLTILVWPGGNHLAQADYSPAELNSPANAVTYNEEVTINNTLRANSAYIGSTAAGVGGVTFFNGTIINTAVDEDGDSTIPVTFGDDVRIDGQIFRAEVGGNNPLKLADSIRPQTSNAYSLGSSTFQFKDAYFAGTVTVADLAGTGVIDSGNIVDGTIVAADLADNAITSAKIANGTITGSDISTSADLSVDSIVAGGDVTQDINADGIVKGLIHYDPAGGGVVKSHGVTITNTWPIVVGVTQFTVSESIGDRYIQVTPLVDDDAIYPYFCNAAFDSSDPDHALEIRCYQPDGTGPDFANYAASAYVIAIY